jgi:hypothetical protein
MNLGFFKKTNNASKSSRIEWKRGTSITSDVHQWGRSGRLVGDLGARVHGADGERESRVAEVDRMKEGGRRGRGA